jgi:hypothetical protein
MIEQMFPKVNTLNCSQETREKAGLHGRSTLETTSGKDYRNIGKYMTNLSSRYAVQAQPVMFHSNV